MTTITIIVAVPNRTLCANGRVHWRTLAGAKKKAKISAYFAAQSALGDNVGPLWGSATVTVKAYFKDRRSKWDRDNFIGAMKAASDGIAAAGIVANDRGVSWGEVDLSGIDKANPRVVLTFTGT